MQHASEAVRSDTMMSTPSEDIAIRQRHHRSATQCGAYYAEQLSLRYPR
ncbi:hypothetical protein HMPREF3196_00870 [Bifidobacterium bifidum]|uniref:Uncharacterized protein n=2 Tax=Bifidobacterium bifidum TaxID=1681 RepID=A0A286TAQ1_BIFBI|nr:hypothetical protein BIFBIF_00655 [Bifidobacterium bifidum ATCC 29521 = JCM 1255 = DSM 20456]KWZ81741.1 hypothetical protein HMPREF3196_00870 [Bifidobacterium bifidum]BBA47299.1 hypothetical protein BBJK_00380 [Bifidobacterium bifidum LMG 13195]